MSHPASRRSIKKLYLVSYTAGKLMMEENLTFLGKWKTTSIFFLMEDDLNFFENGRRPTFFEDDHRIFL